MKEVSSHTASTATQDCKQEMHLVVCLVVVVVVAAAGVVVLLLVEGTCS